jgi:NAD(P)-dependent dehydrogenase (short-subunit alcohol dehydrogenase family)
LHGKVAVVTGAAGGIGRAISRRLAGDGADVAVADINLPGAESVAEEIRSVGRSAIALQVDVTDEDQVEEMIGETTRRFGRVDIGVANAGIIVISPLLDMKSAEWQQQIAVNVTGGMAHLQARR